MKKFIHEIHRRSLWQVLGVYVLGSWLVLQIVNELADALNLPEWAPSFAVFLLIVGLPIVLATAFVQEGVHREADGEPESDTDLEPDATAGGTPMERASTDAKSGGRLLTWRRAIIGGVAAFALWGVAAAVWLMVAGPPDGARDTTADGADGDVAIESIAVLAFADMSPEGDQEHFGDGIAEEILDGLARVPGLKVAARSSSFQYKGQSPDVRDVGSELGVQTVLEGSVRKSEGSLRITVQLISAEDGFHLWSETYDRRDEDIFAVQEDIARSILVALGLDVEDSDLPSFDAPAGGIEAHDYYLLGLSRFHARATLEDVEAALSWFERAVAADSSYAHAHGAIAIIYAALPQWTVGSADSSAARARRAAARAIELDPRLPEPYQALCQSLSWNEWRWEEAQAACERAIELGPNAELSRQWYGEFLALVGRFDDAHASVVRSIELSPLSPVQKHIHAWTHSGRAEYDSAVAIVRPIREMDHDDFFARWNLMRALLPIAGAEDREVLTDMLLQSATTASDSVTHEAFVVAYLGAADDPAKRAEALALVPRLVLPGAFFSLIPHLYTMLGDPEAAIDILEQETKNRNIYVPVAISAAFMRPFRDDPRFQSIWREVYGTMPMTEP
jgi:TolB-like protein